MPGLKDEFVGMPEWKGWVLLLHSEMQTAVKPRQARFVDKQAKGKNDVITIANPDERDNFGDPDAKGNYTTWLSTPEINLKGIEANLITLT